jgi:hypothetical protein
MELITAALSPFHNACRHLSIAETSTAVRASPAGSQIIHNRLRMNLIAHDPADVGSGLQETILHYFALFSTVWVLAAVSAGKH